MALQDGSVADIQQNCPDDQSKSAQAARKPHRWTKYLKFFCQLIPSVIGIAAVIIYGQQLIEMKNTNELTKRALDGNDLTLHRTLSMMQGQIDAVNAGNGLSKYSLIETQRAFLYVTKFNIGPVGEVYKVNFVWTNGGTTPTRFMREATHVRLFKGEMPEQFTLYNPVERGTQMFVGPKADSSGEAAIIPTADLDAIAAHQGHLYIWGWATYLDVFQKTDSHITQFCQELTDVTYSTNTVTFFSTSCKHGNCTDDECKAK